MSTPFQSTEPHEVIKIEDGGSSASQSPILSQQELILDIFRKGMQSSRIEFRKNQGQYNTSGTSSANPPPPAQQPLPSPARPNRLSVGPPPGFADVRQPPVPLRTRPPLPPPKRPAFGPPAGFADVRQPPWKQHQRRPPWQSRAQQPPPQPAQNVHSTPGPSPPPSPANMQLTPQPLSGPPSPAVAGSSARRPPWKKQQQPAVECGICGVPCMTKWHLKDHERGRKHRNKVARLAGEMDVWCQLCNVYLCGALNVQQHYAGKQHRWKLNGAA